MSSEPVAGAESPAQKNWLRTLVFCAALAVMIVITAWPHVFGSTIKDMSHTAAMISMCGMSCGFVYGIGFVPRTWWLRIVFSAPVSFGLMALGFLLR